MRGNQNIAWLPGSDKVYMPLYAHSKLENNAKIIWIKCHVFIHKWLSSFRFSSLYFFLAILFA